MKKIRKVLIAVLTLSLVAGYPLSITGHPPFVTGEGSIQTKETVVKAATSTKFKVQTMGATKEAKKQYQKMSASIMDVAMSLRLEMPGETFQVSDFSLKLPAEWKNNYVVKKIGKKKNDSYVVFYAKKCYNQTKLGWLFSIARYSDESYKELPAYQLLGKKNGIYYVAVYPTDVQSEGATKAAQKQYHTLYEQVEQAAGSLVLK